MTESGKLVTEARKLKRGRARSRGGLRFVLESLAFCAAIVFAAFFGLWLCTCGHAAEWTSWAFSGMFWAFAALCVVVGVILVLNPCHGDD